MRFNTVGWINRIRNDLYCRKSKKNKVENKRVTCRRSIEIKVNIYIYLIFAINSITLFKKRFKMGKESEIRRGEEIRMREEK